MDDFWVFGYASLMWKPGFDYVEKRRARLYGYHRSLCITSYEHRGTRERPGLVMGLDRGGSCVGVAFRVAGEKGERVMAYLRERELVTNVYLERSATMALEKGPKTSAVAYVADRSHGQYAGRLSVEDAVERVCGAVGGMGPNEDYVINTAEHIRLLGIRDHWLEHVVAGIRQQMAVTPHQSG
ncbi:gamma-glutamylcyclotransferase [Oricola sp.]|uniref:gamma-glutamylcyclotransferase n=1 Tax=Oricola sp. TaxID=1979950 RepID=UPI0025D25508|nr:gamma-glutamylcyclotransferase [Oricola sp.]MCI5075167.1 gamma-glutamylcyclotransferase [Oricola sp.]